jgi:hypothetical protein
MQLMIVDEITEFDTIIAIDEDGAELELTENEFDVFVFDLRGRRSIAGHGRLGRES